MKKNSVFKWLKRHSLFFHLFVLLIVAIVGWIMGQLFAPAFLKAIFL